MFRWLADEHVHPGFVAALRSAEPPLDVVTVQEVGLRTRADDELLDWAAANGRILISADKQTIIELAEGRMATGEPLCGLVVYRDSATTSEMIAGVRTIDGACSPDDFLYQVYYIPL